MTGAYVLWGTPHSLYTGKLRSYLIKKGLPFEERLPADPEYHASALPQARLRVVPILKTPDGEILQDTTAIIDRLEADAPGPALRPPGPLLAFIAEVFDAYGSQFLTPAAMHYRWSYRPQQETFLEAEFGRAAYQGPDRDAQREAGRRLMGYFNATLPGLGVTPEAIPAIEGACLEFLDLLDRHFQAHPYLLGGRPSVGDTGLMGPLFAHLGRDPVPAMLMKTRAPNVARWVERMNTPGFADPEFPGRDAFFADDALPETLEAVLAHVFADFAPELAALTVVFEDWLAAEARPAGTPVSPDEKRRVHPSFGRVRYTWRGCPIDKAAPAQTLWHVARAARIAREADAASRLAIEHLSARTGGDAVRKLDLARGLVRADYILVLE